MVKLAEVNYISRRGRAAMDNGEKLFLEWTKEQIIAEVLRIKMVNQPCPAVDYDYLLDLPEYILREMLLKRVSWHHVDGKPEWFYIPNEPWIINMDYASIEDMANDADRFLSIENKPKMADFQISQWKESTTMHQYCKHIIRSGILYNGIAYFENGERKEVIKDSCEVVKVFDKTPNSRRTQFNIIRKKMRQYQIYC